MLPEKGEKYKKASQAEQDEKDVPRCSSEKMNGEHLYQEGTFRKQPVSLREEKLVE